MRTPVSDEAEVARIADAIGRAALVAFDLEFASADRLVPVLCLVQLAWHDDYDAAAAQRVAPEVAMIDPLAVDAGPVVRALAAHPRVVAHAARQDLGLLATRFGVAVPHLADTQVMAAFAGHGDQKGLGDLASELLGVTLAKEQQRTDWERRPLSDAQLAYAEADVLHLPALYGALAGELGERLAWARAESAAVADDAVAASRVTAETAWEQLGTRGLDAATLAAVIALAAWRWRAAVAGDKPLRQVLPDKGLMDLARHRPTTVDGVRAEKELTRYARDRADAIVEALGAARPDLAPVRARGTAASTRAMRWADALLVIAQLVAEQTGVAVRLLGTRADAEELARAVDEGGVAAAAGLPALATWRREVIGAPWLDWLEGRAALVGDLAAPQGMALVAR